MSPATLEFLRGAGIVALASGLLGYVVVRHLDGRWIEAVRNWWTRRDAIVEAYFRGCTDGGLVERQRTIREYVAREKDIIAAAYAAGYNDASKTRGAMTLAYEVAPRRRAH